MMNNEGGKLVIKEAPKNTPEALRPFMRIVQTIRARNEAQNIKMSYPMVLKEAGEEYRKLNPDKPKKEKKRKQ